MVLLNKLKSKRKLIIRTSGQHNVIEKIDKLDGNVKISH